MAVELATAYVSLVPSAKGIQGKIAEQLGGPAEKAGKSAGGRITGALGKALKGGVLAVGAAAGAALGVSIAKGLGRLTAIENARSKLDGLGHSAKSVETIMDNALGAVKGTAFGLGDAATVAASAVAAGIKPGRELERILKLTGDTASIAGSSLGEMGAIFNKVAASNRLSLGEVNQLADRGVPILQMLADQYGVTQGEMAKMVSAGKVDFPAFAKALEDNIGGAALSSGDTTQGAFANMQAAMGRFGAALLQGVFPVAKHVFGAVTRFADWATDAVKPLGDALGNFFLSNDGAVQQFIAGLTLSGDKAKKLGDNLTGLMAVGQRVRDFVLGVRDNTMALVAGFTAGGDKAKGFGSDLGGLAAAGAKVRDLFDDSWERITGIFEKLKSAATDLGPAAGAIATSLAAASGAIGISTWDLLLTTVDLLATALVALTPTIESLAGWMEDNQTAVTVLVGAYTLWRLSSVGITAALKVKAAWVAVNTARVKALDKAQKVAAVSQKAWTAAVNGAKYAQIAGYLALVKVRTVAVSAASKVAAASQRLLNAAVSGGRWVVATAQMLAYKAAALAVSAATKVWSGIQAAFNVIMSMNPIGLVIIAIVALVAAVVLAYKRSETFRKIVDGAFRAVGAAGKWLWEKAIKPAWAGIKKAIDVVASAVTWWWKNIVTPAFNAVSSIAKWLWERIKQYFGLWKGVFDKVREWAGSVVSWVRNKFNWLVDFVRGLPGKMRKAASGMWDGVKNAFRSAINWIIRKWNSLSLTLPSVDIPGIGKIGGFTLRTARIPELAQGGIVPATRGGRIVRVAEAGQAEAIVPLDRLERMLGGRGGGPEVLELTLDLGHGIREVVRIDLRERDRATKRRATALGAT